MPSKSKKQTKTPSSSSLSTKFQSLLQQQDTISSPQTLSNDELEKTLVEASSKFPFFLSKTSLISHVYEFDSSTQQKGSRIWLSEASMLASSISPGSLVSVSLPSLDGNLRSSSPLSSLVAECSEHFGVDWGGEMDDKAGNFFAIATAFPSSKLKDRVRLSLNLSYSLGCPAYGRVVFVHPIHTGPLSNTIHGNGKLYNPHSDHPLLTYCNELWIRPLHMRSWGNMEASSPSKVKSEKLPNWNENGDISSPRTPASERSRLSPSSPSRMSLLSSEESASYLRNTKASYFDSVELHDVIGDESARVLLQHAAVSWLSSRAFLRGNLVTVPLLSRLCLFEVVDMKMLSADKINGGSLDRPYIINQATSVKICLESDLASEISESTPGKMKSRDPNLNVREEIRKLGGLWKEYKLLCDLISSSMKNALSSLGLRTTKGVLLYGPPGTGKTSLAQLCARDAGVSLFKVNGPEIVSQYYGESEQALHDVFKSASLAAPSVIFIDELDAIAPARKEGGDELSQRMVATLLNLMDGISRTEGLLIIAATNRVECIEPALRRPGRLDREVEIGVPSPDQRLDILTTLLGRMQHSLSDAQIHELAVTTHGFVGADLAALSNEAAMACLRRCIISNKPTDDFYANNAAGGGSDVIMNCSSYQRNGQALPSGNLLSSLSSAESELTATTNGNSSPFSGEAISTQDIHEGVESDACSVAEEHVLRITFEDFERARMKIRPSAMREVILEVPKVNWRDVGGQEEVKAQLMEAVEWPQKHQDAFSRIGTRPPTGVLLFGPPGCSKTLMARAVASEAGLNFLAVKGPELFSKWVGESEKAVRSLFAKARANAPSIIFFDEIDSLAIIRGKENDGVSVGDRVMSQLLVELDGLQERVNVTVIAATNRPDKIDPALLRPGRFDRLLYVGPPSEKDRIDVFRVHLQKMPCSSDVDLTELARLTEGCTGADISLICREAAISAIEDNLDASEIKMEQLERAILHVRPSEIEPYQQLSERFQRIVYSKTQSDDLGSHCQPAGSKAISSWNPVKWIPQLAYRFSASLSWRTTP